MKTFVIGIDGGEWDVINPMIANGDLPHLSEIVENGYSGDLESVTPPVSPPAWATIQTGVNPSKHGIFDFVQFDEEHNPKWLSSTDRQSTPFWRVMNDEGVSTGLFKIPFTYPPDDVTGFMVSGFPTPNSATDFVSPESVDTGAKYPKDLFENNYLKQSGDWSAFKENLIGVAEHQTDVFIDLIDDHDTEFLMAVYDGADRIQHFFWHYFDENHPYYRSDTEIENPIREYYKAVDDGVGRILERLDEEVNIVLISDHGFGPLTHEVYIDGWLESNGYIEYDEEASKTFHSALSRIVEMTWDLLRRSGIEDSVLRLVPDTVIDKGRDIRHQRTTEINWGQSSAFFTTVAGQSIIINHSERFTDGTVTDSDYEDVVDELTAKLGDLVDPATGEPIVEEVYHPKQSWEGWALSDAPDMIIETIPRFSLKGGRSDDLVTPSKRTGNYRSGDHRKMGIFAAMGPDFGEGTVPQIGIADIAPTLLYLQKCPIPSTMDGRVVTEIFETDISDKRTVKTTDKYGRESGESHGWSKDEAEDINDRLRSLGYVE